MYCTVYNSGSTEADDSGERADNEGNEYVSTTHHKTQKLASHN